MNHCLSLLLRETSPTCYKMEQLYAEHINPTRLAKYKHKTLFTPDQGKVITGEDRKLLTAYC